MIESIAILVILGAVFGLVLSLMKFSPSPAYLLAGFVGVLLGIKSPELSSFSEFGVIMLLFAVGIEMNLKKIFSSYRIIVVGILQMIGSFLSTYLLASYLGYSGAELIIISVAFMFSSTAVVLKTLFDKGLLDSAVGEIATGVLILGDVVAALAIAMVSKSSASIIGLLGLLIFLLVSKFFFDFTFGRRQVSLETVFILSIAVAFGASAIAANSGLSYGMGALLAGMALSFAESRHEISSLFRSLKDFFLLLFFIFIGSFVPVSNLSSLIFLIIPLFVTPLVILFSAKLMGFPTRIALISAMSLANLSAFSLVLVWTASSIGMVSSGVMGVVALNVMVSMLVSPIVLQLFLDFEGVENDHVHKGADIYLFGAHTTGGHILSELKKRKVIIIDSNPHNVRSLKEKGYNSALGDAGDLGFLSSMKIENSKLVISTVPDAHSNLVLLKYLKKKQSEAIVVLVSHTDHDAKILKEKGADTVVIPKQLAGRHISLFIKELKL